jgi:hypothetical protein
MTNENPAPIPAHGDPHFHLWSTDTFALSCHTPILTNLTTNLGMVLRDGERNWFALWPSECGGEAELKHQ